MEMFGSSSDDESDDEWFYKSIKRYEDLLMYNVQGRVSSLSCLDNHTLLLAVSRGEVHEVSEVRVPDKLVAGRNAGLVKNRDFILVAVGYTNTSVSQVIWTSAGVVTSGPEGVQLYSKDESDVISLVRGVRSDVKNASLAVAGSTIYSGETLTNIATTDLNSHMTRNLSVKPREDSHDKQRVSRMSVIRDNLFLGLKEKGKVLLYNDKAGLVTQEIEAGEVCSGSWTMDVSQDGTTVALAASTGALSVFDVRNSTRSLFTFTSDTQLDLNINPEVHFSPTGLLLSLSGSDKQVQVVECKCGEGSNKTIFVHDGHRGQGASRIVAHLWHPTQERLLFSADDDSNVQAWRFR